MEAPGRTVSTTIANALLVLFLISFSISVSLGAFLYYQHDRTQAELARLAEENSHAKSRQQLQAELMQGNNRFSLFPHADKRVGFVLNRHMVSTSLYAANDRTYHINSIGLRGNDIEPKAPDVTRIALVSDSWFFGWRLSQEDRLETVLSALLASHYRDRRYEVITVAVPGWNVENQAAFLEDYFYRLQPDFLVWSINPNDLWDTQSVVPPGVPATRPAPSSAWLCPDMDFEWTLSPTPIVLERWKRNIALMEEFSKNYHAPILALHAHEYEPYISTIRKVGGPHFPIVATPMEYQKDERWSIEPGVDAHPTAWATRLMAVDILGHLIEHHHLPATELSEDEQVIIAKGQAASRGMPDKVDSFINATHGIPSSYDRASARMHNMSITPKWDVCPQGRISVGRPAGTKTAEVSFDQVRNDGDGSNKLICTARTKDGQSYKGEGVDRDGMRTCSVSVPPSRTPEILDIYWQFQKFDCDVADECYSARFKSAKIF